MSIDVRPSNDRDFVYARSGPRFLAWAKDTGFFDKLNARRPASAVTADEAEALLTVATADLLDTVRIVPIGFKQAC